MSSDTVTVYEFKPFEFTVLKQNGDPLKLPLARLEYRTVCNEAYLFAHASYNRPTTDASGRPMSSTVRELGKYCFDLGEWKIITCKVVPQELVSSSVILLSGNIIIIYGGYNNMYLGNLANEYEEVGMQFEKLEVSGNVPLPLYRQGVVMDSKYIYSIGGTSSYQYEMDVHRLDLSTKTWELLHKSSVIGRESWPRCRCQPVFYKGRINIFGNGRGDSANIYDRFSEIHMFDVTTKQWEFLPAKQDYRFLRTGYPSKQGCYSCVQCPKKPNLMYICGGYNNGRSCTDVWRFNLDNLQWEKLSGLTMPQRMRIHSTAMTPTGRMCCYGGIVSSEDQDESCHSNNIMSAWITIPKLKVICWEAMVHYFKDQMLASSDTQLKEVGLPREYYERIIKARRHVF